MSISPAGGASSAYTTAAAQLKVDQQKLQADEKAKAEQAQLEADEQAVMRDEQAVAVSQDSGTSASTSTSTSTGIAANKPALTANAGAKLDVYA